MEAALAIRKNPELEDFIVEVILALDEVKKREHDLKLASKPIEGSDAMDCIINKIKHHETQLAVLRQKLVELGGEKRASQSITATKKKQEAIKKLKVVCGRWLDHLRDNNVDLVKLLPSLEEYV